MSAVRHRQVARPFSTFEKRTFRQFVSSLRPYLWFRMNETSGTTAINYGQGGTGLNGTFTPGNGAVNQIGQFGLASAYSFDGADTKINIPNSATYANSPDFTICMLVNPTNAGENNNGAFWAFGATNFRSIYASTTQFNAGRILATTNPSILTTSGQVPTNGVWQWVIYKYNNTTDKKMHVYKGYKGKLTQFTYTTDTAGVGSISSQANTLNIGNISTNTCGWNGLMGNFLWLNEDLPLAKCLDLVKLSKV